MSLTIHTLDSLTSWEIISALQFTELTHGWFNQTLHAYPKFTLVLDTQNLYFIVRSPSPPFYNTNIFPGEFAENLWHWDVAELFIKDDSNNSYQEFNLAPNGAWWSAVFSDTRKQTNFKAENMSVRFNIYSLNEQDWSVGLAIPLKEMGIKCSFKTYSQGLVCLIFGKTEPRNYFTSNNIPLLAPDFHQVKFFENVRIKAL